MKVLADTSILRRPATGTARWINGLLTAVAAQPDVDLMSAMGPARLGSEQVPGGRADFARWLVRVPNVARQRWWYEVGIRRVARRIQADVLLMPANLSARRGRPPQVVAILDVNFLTAPGTYEPANARYLEWAFRRSIANADRLITISAYSRSEICRHLGADPAAIDVVYPGLAKPADHVPTLPPLDRPYALWVGATEVSKNLALLLDAWSGGAPGALTLAIVGPPGRDHHVLSRRAVAIGSDVLIRGPVDQQELERWYRHAAVFVFPSRSEGFGFPPLEAMQRGIPVIASDAGSLPEVLGHAALYHDPDDPDAVRAQIARVVSDEALRATLISRGIDQAARYGWDRAGADVASILQTTASLGIGRT